MRNPYEVLGIKEGATAEEIKAAYKEQVKKYHPDRHQDNPLYELAEERLREINEAYENLMNNKGGTGVFGQGSGWQGSGYSSNQNYQQVRVDIDRGNLVAAESTLSSISNRDAEWYFLYGMLNLRKGWYDDAMTNIQLAVSMDPGNTEYRQALNSMVMRAGNYRTSSYQRGYTSEADEFCRMLQCCCCANMLCDCC